LITKNAYNSCVPFQTLKWMLFVMHFKIFIITLQTGEILLPDWFYPRWQEKIAVTFLFQNWISSIPKKKTAFIRFFKWIVILVKPRLIVSLLCQIKITRHCSFVHILLIPLFIGLYGNIFSNLYLNQIFFG